ncbi:MAG: response regulator transcription factor [Clostridia bacterium]|nr:response regulator transcription factor [Clostridia bacterium]MBQ7048557.1 response regulator transcription factor [Clostridia bacterium]
MRILVADDERDLNAVISRRLALENFSVDSCYDGEEAVDYLSFAEYDCVVLDIMMPKLSGLQVLEWIRNRKKNTPVLLLTAKDAVNDRVTGLNAGADDYIIKPFSLDELIARIHAVTRRQSGNTTNVLTAGNLVMNINTHSVTRGGVEINLSSKEFAILEYLLKNKGNVLSREKIEEHIWNYDYEGGSNVIDVYISYLRKKVDGENSEKLIKTVRGVGYIIKD